MGLTLSVLKVLFRCPGAAQGPPERSYIGLDLGGLKGLGDLEAQQLNEPDLALCNFN